MGREWYWTGKSSKRDGGGADAENPSGCMCAFFQFFDFHPLHFPIQQQQPSFKPASRIPDDQSIPKGAEAPRNSLESEDGTMYFISKEEIFKIPKSLQIKTSTGERAGNGNDLSSEMSSSPGTKTPTLVARLMGLDLLPDAQSPSSSSSCLSTPNPQGNRHLHNVRPRHHIQTKPRKGTDTDIAASRSLPETPRISSARKSDVDHRLSLQINRENMGIGQELELPRFSFSRRKFEEHSSRSPSHYARQIVKQVRESVSRKVGLDITNTVKNRDQQTRDELVSQFRVKKSPNTSLKAIDEKTSCSPRLRLPLTQKDQNLHPVKLPSPPPVKIEPQISRALTKAKPQSLPEQELQNKKSVPKCKKVANERFSPRLRKPPQTSDIIRSKQEESFVGPTSTARANDIKTKSKRTHSLSCNLLNLTTVPNLLPVKTDPSPPPVTKIPHKQLQVSDIQESKRSSQLSSCSSQTYEQEQEARYILAKRESNDKEKSNDASTTGACGPEFEYVTDILSRAGVDKGTRIVPFNKWYSTTHPLDPSIFHHLEQYPTSISSVSSVSTAQDSIFTSNNQMGLHCNRRLLFDLVAEILGEILMASWPVQNYYCGSTIEGPPLFETVCKKIRSFPCANCQVLEDIDALIEPAMKEGLDLGKEAEGLVEEIEGKIMETLVHETVVACSSVRTNKTESFGREQQGDTRGRGTEGVSRGS